MTDFEISQVTISLHVDFFVTLTISEEPFSVTIHLSWKRIESENCAQRLLSRAFE